MTEIFRYLNRLLPDLKNEVFKLKSSYHNLRNLNQFETYIPKTKSSLNSSVYRTNQSQKLSPHEIRKLMSLTQFRSKISNWFCQKCPYHLCKKYVKNDGYISQNRFFSYYVKIY